MQFNSTHVQLNRLAGDFLSRNIDIPADFVITRPSGSLLRSVGDNSSRLQCAHRLSNFQLMKLLSISHASSKPYLGVPFSMEFLRLHSELSIRYQFLRVFPVLFQKVVRLSQILVHYSHATIFLPADTSTTTHDYLKACFCAPSCVNQSDFLSLLGDNFAAISFNCNTSTFVGHYFQFGIQFVFGRHIFDISFHHSVPSSMILQCNYPSQYFDDFVYAERSFQSFSSFFKTQLFPVILPHFSILTLSTILIIDRHFRRARFDFLTQLLFQVTQSDMQIVFGLSNERPSFRRAGSSHENLSLFFLISPSIFISSATQHYLPIFIIAIPSMVESSLVWAVKGRLLDALAHSAESLRCFSSFAFELI